MQTKEVLRAARLALALEKGGILPHALKVLCHGRTVFEKAWAPHDLDTPHVLNSATKTFVSMAAGLAISEGLLTLDSPICDYFDLPQALCETYRGLRVRHLLNMTTGHDVDLSFRRFEGGFLRERWAADEMGPDWVHRSLGIRPAAAPGERFAYANRGPCLLSCILTRLTGQSLVDYLTPRLFEPLHISKPAWEQAPAGCSRGASGLRLNAHELARFGQMLLDGGRFEDRQIIPEDWVREAARRQAGPEDAKGIPPDWAQGYGYGLWMCRHGAYRADGACGQYCVVMPGQDMVVVLLGGRGRSDDMQQTLDIIWQYLLTDEAEPLEPEYMPDTLTFSKQVFQGRYALQHNWANLWEIGLTIMPDGARLTWRDWLGEYALGIGLDDYGPASDIGGEKLAAKGWWADARTFCIRAAETATPYAYDLRFTFESNRMTLCYHALHFITKEETFHGAKIDLA